MKILCLADIHISWWSNKCIILESGIPDRLHIYELLAKDILTIAKNNNIDVIVIAGDITNSSTVRPEVAFYIKKFLSILSSDRDIDLVLTLGQHDLSVKNDNFEDLHSIITSLVPTQRNIYYCIDEQYLTIKGRTFHVVPWRMDVFKDYKKADCFISHGFVTGCTDSSGWSFDNGFSKYDLTDNYQVSIVGDIHHHQVHTVNNRYVIQPGCPHSNKFGDDPVTGIYLYDLDSTTPPQFINNLDFEHSDSYYTFITLDEDEFDEYIDLRPNTVKKCRVVKKEEDSKKISGISLDLQEIFKQLTLDKTQLQEIFTELYTTSNTANLSIPQNVTLKSVTIENFLSIENFYYEFADRDELLIVGSNGSGKTSLLEAIFFCLTDDTTKKIEKDKLIREGAVGFRIELAFSIGDDNYHIIRSRSKKSPSLTFCKGTVVLTQTSIAETQKLIFNTLGITKEELFLFDYFSAKGYQGFCGLAAKEKYGTISKLANTDKLDAIRDVNTKKLTALNSDLKSNIFYVEQLNKDILQFNKNIEESDKEMDLIDIEQLNNSITDIDKQIEECNSNLFQWDKDKLLVEQLKQKVFYLNSQNDKLLKDLTRYQVEEKSLLENICPTCNQEWHSNSIKDKLTTTKKLIETSLDTMEINYKDIESTVIPIIDYKTREEISKFITSYKQDKLEYQNQITAYNFQLSKIAKIQAIKDQLINTTEKIDKANLVISDLDKPVALHKEIEIIISRNGIVASTLLTQIINILNKELSSLLLNSGIAIKFVLNKEIDVVVSINGKNERDFDNLSSGESKIVDIALVTAFINTYSNIYSLNNGLLGYAFFDELFTFLDPVNLQLCKNILDQCVARKIVITHENDLINLFDRKLFVTKQDDVSIYKLI